MISALTETPISPPPRPKQHQGKRKQKRQRFLLLSLMTVHGMKGQHWHPQGPLIIWPGVERLQCWEVHLVFWAFQMLPVFQTFLQFVSFPVIDIRLHQAQLSFRCSISGSAWILIGTDALPTDSWANMSPWIFWFLSKETLPIQGILSNHSILGSVDWSGNLRVLWKVSWMVFCRGKHMKEL